MDSWDAAGLELGFARPPSNERLGTFGSTNVVPVPVAVLAPGIRVVGASTSSSLGATGNGNATAGGGGERRSPFMRPGAASLPFVEGRSNAPHLSLDLDDAPPGAEGRWRLLGASAHSLLGSSSSLGAASQEWAAGAGAEWRGTFGVNVSGTGTGTAASLPSPPILLDVLLDLSLSCILRLFYLLDNLPHFPTSPLTHSDTSRHYITLVVFVLLRATHDI